MFLEIFRKVNYMLMRQGKICTVTGSEAANGVIGKQWKENFLIE